MERWVGKVAVVTGASTGIGANLVEQLVRHGVKVVGLARRFEIMSDNAKTLASDQIVSFNPVKCDLRKEEDILAAFKFVEENFGCLHILINNAGVLSSETIIDGKTETYKQILDVNVLAPAICIREAVRLMRKNNVHGHIINVNSMAGHCAENIQVPVSLYCASKYALTGMTASVRNELSTLKCGIKITSVSPGAVNTPMLEEFGVPKSYRENCLQAKNIVDAILYALGTPPHVQVNELSITPMDKPLEESQKS